MHKRAIGCRMICCGLLGWVAGGLCAQEYPSRTIRIVTTTVGGGSDMIARVSAQGMSGALGQSVIVDNRGSGIIPATTVWKAPPDGYTLLVHTSSVWISPLLQKVPYDPIRDLAPIALLVRAPTILVVHPQMPVKSVKELIALAKSRPGEINFGAGTKGSTSHLAGELFKSMAGINVVRISYGSSAAATEASDLISGQVQYTFSSPGSLGAHVKTGRLRALAITSPQASSLFPGLPPVAATVPGFEAGTLYGMWGPVGTPDAIVKRLHQEVVRVLRAADTRDRLLAAGVEVAGSTPDEFAGIIKNETSRLGKLIKEAGIE